MRALLEQFVEWFLELHTFAKVAWIMGIFVVLLFVVPWFFGENLVKGDPDDRTRKAAKTLRQLETLSGDQGYSSETTNSTSDTISQRRQDREERGNQNDDNDRDNDDDRGGGSSGTDL